MSENNNKIDIKMSNSVNDDVKKGAAKNSLKRKCSFSDEEPRKEIKR